MINNQTTVDYAIISAMEEESEFFTKQFAGCKCINYKINDFTFKIYEYRDQKILIAYSGLGTTFAASILTLIYSRFNPKYYFITGTAGAVNTALKIRDVVIVEKAFEAELQDIFSALKNTPFESCLTHPLKKEVFPSHYSADTELLNLCSHLQCDDVTLHRGTVVSSNAFPAPKELFEKIKQFSPYSIDMETSAFYQTAWLFNLKILAVRGISNALQADGTDDQVHESDVKGSAQKAAEVLFRILNQSIELNKKKELNLNQVLEDKSQDDAVAQLIRDYSLQAHPEGGYFAATFKSADRVMPADKERYNYESRSAGTAIYYLLNRDNFSAWHVLKSDELWHFYKGSALYIYTINNEGKLTTYLLGDPLITSGATFQVYIKAGTYFAAENVNKNSYAFVGCTVTPGFEYADFRLADKEFLADLYPQHKTLIERLSPLLTEQEDRCERLQCGVKF